MLKELHAEREQLERELEHNIIYQKLVLVRDLIEVYEAEMRDANASLRTEKPSPRRDATQRREAAADACYAILQGRSVPTMTAELDRLLIGRGLGLPGKDAVSRLSAALGKDSRFSVRGRRGWLLAEQSKTGDEPPVSPGGDQDDDDDADRT